MSARGTHRLSREERLRRRPDFLRVQGGGRRMQTQHFLVFLTAPSAASPGGVGREVGLPPLRVGVTVTRKVGNAVLRNRIKRLVREVFRRHKDWFPPEGEIVFVARAGQKAWEFAALEHEVEALCRQRFARR